MIRKPSVGEINAMLVAAYFLPLCSREAVAALTSPVYGLTDPDFVTVAVFYRQLFDLAPGGLARVASVLGGIKLVMAAGFLALIIDVVRGIVIGRKGDEATVNVALLIGALGLLVWSIPFYAAGDAAMMRLIATQALMISGAVIVVMVQRLAMPAEDVLGPVRFSLDPEQRPLPMRLDGVPVGRAA